MKTHSFHRVALKHTPPLGIPHGSYAYFITVCSAKRGEMPILNVADQIFAAARNYQERNRWHLTLLLLMPDHFHFLVYLNPLSGENSLAKIIGCFKRYIARATGIELQSGFFDTRIRNEKHYAEKWRYILYNPVRKGLVSKPREWPYVIAFDRESGKELEHR